MSTSGSHRKHVDQCLNCGAPTPGAYCAACGQEAVDAAVTFRDQMAHFFEEVFSVEARLLQTLRMLLFHPGGLTRAYNSGQRVRFVTPLKMYLFTAAGFFLILSISAARAPAPTPTHDRAGKIVGYGVNVGPPVSPGMHVTRTNGSADAGADAGAPDVDNLRTPEEFDAWLQRPGNRDEIPAFIQPLAGLGYAIALVTVLSVAAGVVFFTT